jgi:hypothetical protein
MTTILNTNPTSSTVLSDSNLPFISLCMLHTIGASIRRKFGFRYNSRVEQSSDNPSNININKNNKMNHEEEVGFLEPAQKNEHKYGDGIHSKH